MDKRIDLPPTISDQQALALIAIDEEELTDAPAESRARILAVARARYAAMLAVSDGGATKDQGESELHVLMDGNAWRAAMIGLCNAGREADVGTPELAAEHLRRRLAARPAQVETAIRVTKVPLTKEQRDGLTVKNDVHIPGIAQADTAEPIPVEMWREDRKVTIYPGENVIRIVNGECIHDEAHTLDSAQAAFEWLAADSEAQAETESERETGPSLYEVNMNCMSVLHNNRNASEQKELDLVSEQVTENDEVKEREFKQEEFTRKWLESIPLTHKLNGLIKRKT